MKASTLVLLLIVLGLTFLGLWQFSVGFRNLLGLKGRPLDWLMGTGGTNNGPAVGGGGGEQGSVSKAGKQIQSMADVPAPEVSSPPTGNVTRAVSGLKSIISRTPGGVQALAAASAAQQQQQTQQVVARVQSTVNRMNNLFIRRIN